MRMNITLAKVAMTLLLLLALPAQASDYTLGVFGNANEDNTVNMQDVTYTELIILEYRDETELSDAKYDKKINMQDVTQIELIILGKEKELTILDGNGGTVTVEKPVERILVEYTDNAEMVRALGAKDKVAAVDYAISQTKIQFPELSKLPCVGNMFRPDYEAVLNTKAEGYTNWRIGIIDDIKSRTAGISEEEKPRVFICSYGGIIRGDTTFRTYAMIDTLTQMSITAGGKNIAESLPDFGGPKNGITVDPEWVIEQNPEFIIIHAVRYTWGGGTMEPSHGYDEDDPTDVKGQLVDELMSRPEMANVAAVANGNVYVMSGNFRNDATGGSVGAAYMARLFHPDIFADMDPEAIHQEFLTDFQELDYDLNEHGVFVYPPIDIEGGLAGIPDRYRE
jgi:iron complex transport system substrate-binding protein